MPTSKSRRRTPRRHALTHIANEEQVEAAAAPTHGAAPGEIRTRFSGRLYTLAQFGDLVLSLDYYIDSLTLVMFMMVTLIATCIHVFAMGYMSDELTEDHVDHEVHPSTGGHFHRPGRYYRFFSYMSLFCFSMLGLVLAGNIFQVFIFWELVGICSYLLIGFYVERRSASTAANKAFIMNRVGDFGFLIGLMIFWTSFGTFHFTEHDVSGQTRPGLFEMLRDPEGRLSVSAADNMVHLHDGPEHQTQIPYMLLVTAGLGIFAGCVGKSAQFPLANLASRRDGRADARFRARALGHDGGRRRVSGRPVLSDVHSRSADHDCLRRLYYALRGGDDRRSWRPISNACSPIRRSANWAT